ncbi:BON domain-containing protein [Nitrosococcus wardiae]|uniref:Osmotically-inducible protein Y n=1 Tax=Nitrosococcus wardiae TaxID=1814290 RepID=A0A4P7C2G3_9GAMM|nr:BON domain-containing protein [Nitrosococcus wardiae]QBQ55704.1 BON domain-containing protein [Nitrosococcus wardiae]
MENSMRYKGFLLCVFLTVGMLGCAPSPEKSAGTHVDDAWITTKVKSKLLADPEVSGLDIEVETHEGVVQLSGFVDTWEQAREAEDLAQSVKGVREVNNKLSVR